MYTTFFGLNKRPFVLTADPEFFFPSRVHNIALTHLEYGLSHRLGFMALTGETGTGKTILVKHLLEKTKGTLEIAMIFNTNLDANSLLEMLAREFELPVSSSSKGVLCEALFRHFMERYSQGRPCVIVVDEAQNLPLESFEELRMLSNLEIGQDVLLQIILVGQPRLRARLAHPSLRQLAQRISVDYHLSRLYRAEVAAYIVHRLQVAGRLEGEAIFLASAVEKVFQSSGGLPRIINLLCDAAMAYAYAEGNREIVAETVVAVLAEGRIALEGLPGATVKLGSFRDESGNVGTPTEGLTFADPDCWPRLAHLMERLAFLQEQLRQLPVSGGDDAFLDLTSGHETPQRPWEQAAASLRHEFRELQSEVLALRRSLAAIKDV